MTARPAASAAILTYLRVANEPRPMLLLRRYMETMHKASAGQVRTAVWRLRKAGMIERTEDGRYRMTAQGTSAGGDARLTTAPD